MSAFGSAIQRQHGESIETTPFDRHVLRAVHSARKAIRFAKTGRIAFALDDLRWAWFYGGKVSDACSYGRGATLRTLDRSALVERVLTRAATIVTDATMRAIHGRAP